MVNVGCWVPRLSSVLMEMAWGQLTQCCQSTKHGNLANRWWSKVTGPYSIGIGFTLWILTLGESLRVQNWPLLRQDRRHPRLRRSLGFQIWSQASTSSYICRCSYPSDQRASSSKNRSHVSKIRRSPRGFSRFLSRSLAGLLSWLQASQSLGLD